MSKQLPAQPNLEQLKKQAKDLRKAYQQADPKAMQRIKDHHPRLSSASDSAISPVDFSLQEAQLILAREFGFPSWSKLVAGVTSSEPHSALPEGAAPTASPDDVLMSADEMEAALAYLGLEMERFGCEAADHHDIHVSLHLSANEQKHVQNLAALSLDPRKPTLLLFMHQKDDKINFAIQSGSTRCSGAFHSTNGCNARAWDRLTTDPLPVGQKVPIFAWVANHESLTSASQDFNKPIDDILLEYDMAVVVTAEIRERQD